VARKKNIGAYWNNATEATAAFNDAGCTIGQTWDTTGILLNRENAKWQYTMPTEGGLGWIDTMAIPSGAANLDQAYAFINFMLTPEIGGMFANNTGYNSAAAGADAFGVGSYISGAPPIDMTMDLKEVDGRPVAKRGRIPGRTPAPRLVRML
ncbi:MAG: extracellular solute-binding protein, partial [Limnochordales bacterium]